MHRIYNFSAGPSMLPIEVLKSVQEELLDYHGSGMSVMEMSHRSTVFTKIIEDAETNLRKLMNISEDYSVLFVQGGATLQFSMVPINMMKNKKADYIVTGSWADKAAKEAAKFGDIKIVASSKDNNYSCIPIVQASDFRVDADYVHITPNNTIYGTRYSYVPDTGDIPLVADFSSSILSEEIDVSKFGIIYAGAQKNIAPAGVAIVIIRKDLIGNAPEDTPVYLDYATHDKSHSLYNTPPSFDIYIAGEVFKYLLAKGGITVQQKYNEEKANALYDYIDSSELYSAPAKKEDRSLMNVVFVTGDEELDKKFVADARAEGFVELAGHRSIGGMRASIYNAMPREGIDQLIAFMKKFEEGTLNR